MPQANFIRNSIAYKEDGTQVGINEPRFESGKFGKAIMVEEGTTNLVSNPSFESGMWSELWSPSSGTATLVTGWNGSGNATRITITKEDGTFGIVSARNMSLSEGVKYTISFRARAIRDNFPVTYMHLMSSSVGNSALPTINLGTTWQRYTITYTIPAGKTASDYGLMIAIDSRHSAVYANDWIEVDDVQIETKPYPTSFTTGTRSPESLTIPTNILNPKQGTVELWVKVNDSMKYVPKTGWPTMFLAESLPSNAKGIWLAHHMTGSYFLFRIRNEDNLYKELTLPDSQVPNGWHHFAFSWDSSEAKLYLDGVLKGTMVSPYLPNTIQNIYVGCWGSAHQINSLVDDLRISNRVRTQEEILETYTKGFYAHADYFTTYKHSFDTINSEIYLPDNYYNIPWQDPVFNRTQEDVLEALRRIREWKENGGEFEELKGCLNVSDLMRIEYDTKYLSWILNEYYFTNTVSTKRWDMLGLPNIDDVNRIISNIQNIINSYYTHPDAPPLPNTMLTYSDINAIEENLFRIMEIIGSMKLSFQKSGMFKAAGRRMLPLKRG